MRPSTPSSLYHSIRVLVVLVGLAALASQAGAQGPNHPADPAPVAAESPVQEVATLLSANVARLTIAGTPRPVRLATTPLAALTFSTQAFRDSILVSVVRTALGTRYVRGGQSFDGGFDCSGLVRYVMSALHVNMPRTAAQQAASGVALGRDATRLRPGDLLTFGRNKRGVSHIGIYVGGGRFVHASSVAGQVVESDIARQPSALVKPWRDTRRVLYATDADSTAKGGG